MEKGGGDTNLILHLLLLDIQETFLNVIPVPINPHNSSNKELVDSFQDGLSVAAMRLGMKALRTIAMRYCASKILLMLCKGSSLFEVTPARIRAHTEEFGEVLIYIYI